VTGAFLVIEGPDGSGKTTQVELLAARLRARGLEVLTTREPGGTPLGQRLRVLLLDADGSPDPRTETLLLAADRAEHVARVVRPALAAGRVVVSDRFVPSSLVYQGVGRGLGVVEVERLNRWATAGLDPDRVVVLDADPGLLAARGAGGDRLEREPPGFHQAVRDAYRDLAAARGWRLVDASGAPGDVAERVWAAVADRLGAAAGPGAR
jgi:dTMP kinase